MNKLQYTALFLCITLSTHAYFCTPPTNAMERTEQIDDSSQTISYKTQPKIALDIMILDTHEADSLSLNQYIQEKTKSEGASIDTTAEEQEAQALRWFTRLIVAASKTRSTLITHCNWGSSVLAQLLKVGANIKILSPHLLVVPSGESKSISIEENSHQKPCVLTMNVTPKITPNGLIELSIDTTIETIIGAYNGIKNIGFREFSTSISILPGIEVIVLGDFVKDYEFIDNEKKDRADILFLISARIIEPSEQVYQDVQEIEEKSENRESVFSVSDHPNQ